jgi:putative flippase GtrA
MIKKWIESILDLLYPPFSKWMDKQSFRYLACGGGNTVLDILIFFVSYNFILHKEVIHLPWFAISPYIAAFLIAFCISFPLGFYLSSNIVFKESTVHSRVQLFRYMMTVLICFCLNYVFIKLFVEAFHFYPTVAKILTTVIVVCFSYLTQKHFTFKVKSIPKS